MSSITLTRVSPTTTIQDWGRPGLLAHGIGASGPMDRQAFAHAERLVDLPCGAAIEIGPLGLDLVYVGEEMSAGLAGGEFTLDVNGQSLRWPARVKLNDGARVSVRPGPNGNYAYLRFSAQINVQPILGSRATNATVGLGGLDGRALRAGDIVDLIPLDEPSQRPAPIKADKMPDGRPIRFVWGIHADMFEPQAHEDFCAAPFRVSSRMDRMGVRLEDAQTIFADATILGLVSDAVVPGDIQILGDGTPIVLMRDHQPTGGYPRIGTIIDADLDRFAQVRPGRTVHFAPVTVAHAHRISGWTR